MHVIYYRKLAEQAGRGMHAKIAILAEIRFSKTRLCALGMRSFFVRNQMLHFRNWTGSQI